MHGQNLSSNAELELLSDNFVATAVFNCFVVLDHFDSEISVCVYDSSRHRLIGPSIGGEVSRVGRAGKVNKVDEIGEIDKVDEVGKADKIGKVGKIGEVGEVDEVGEVGEVCKVVTSVMMRLVIMKFRVG